MYIVNTKDLKKAVQAIGAVSKGKKSLKVLEYVTLEGRHGGYLSITGTDLETAVKIDIPAAISGNTAAVAVHYKTLADGLKGMKENQVSIKIDESGQVMLSGTESGDIIQSVFDIAEYPVTPKVKKWASFSVSTREFLTGLETIFFTIDKDEPRPHFRGGLLHLKDEYINMVGTDTKQLIIKKVQYQNGLVLRTEGDDPEIKKTEPENIRKVLIPHDSIKKLLSILKGASGTLEVIADNQHIRIYGKDIIVTCLLFGNPEDFPKYESVIPSGNKIITCNPDGSKTEKDVQKITVSKNLFPLLSGFDKYFSVSFSFNCKEATITGYAIKEGGYKREPVYNHKIQATISGESSEPVYHQGSRLADFFRTSEKLYNPESVIWENRGGKLPAVMTFGDVVYVTMPLRPEEAH